MKYKLREVALMCGGKLFGDENKLVEKLFLDSREFHENGLFVPIVGEKVDAHKFLPMIFEKNLASFSEKELDIPQANYILVENSKKALQEFSLKHRQKFDIPFIAVTGSVGKTTTKEMIGSALSSINTLKTLGNANSQLGLPLTLLRVEENHDCAIIEMGMSLPKEMEQISYCARPNFAVFTNVGVSHIEYHGTREKIMEEKLHITDYFDENSILFVNGDDDLLQTLKGNTTYKVIEFGLSEHCDYKASEIYETENGTSFVCEYDGQKINMNISVLGEHNIRNALVAFAVSRLMNIDVQTAVENIAKYQAPTMRQQIIKTEKCTIIDDSYNSSPDSAKCAIDVLAKLEGRKIAILGDMLELGAYSKTGHMDVGKHSQEMNIDFVISFGEESREISKACENGKSIHFSDFEEACSFLADFVRDGDNILVKGSRGMKTDRFVKYLVDDK